MSGESDVTGSGRGPTRACCYIERDWQRPRRNAALGVRKQLPAGTRRGGFGVALRARAIGRATRYGSCGLLALVAPRPLPRRVCANSTTLRLRDLAVSRTRRFRLPRNGASRCAAGACGAGVESGWRDPVVRARSATPSRRAGYPLDDTVCATEARCAVACAVPAAIESLHSTAACAVRTRSRNQYAHSIARSRRNSCSSASTRS